MKLFKKLMLVLLVLLILFVANIFISTGYFRSIENKFDGEIVKMVALKGAEDITISHKDKFAIISTTNRQVYPPKEKELGGLYLMDLKDEAYNAKPLTSNFTKDFAPHGISIFKKDSTYKVMAISHIEKTHSIEIFNLVNNKLIFERTLKDESMISPNDIVIIDENRFYFTNDHKHTEGLGRLSEDYLGRALSNVIYFDGENYREVASGIAYANGINYDRNRNLLFVASPRKFLIKVYQPNEDGSLEFIEDIKCKTGVDNIEFDEGGNLWVGAHPKLLHFSAYATGKKDISPSEIIKIAYKEKGNYSIETIYLEDGSTMSASTVAAPFRNLILTGNVMDDKFLVLKKNQ